MNPQYSRYYTYVKPIFRNPYTKTYLTLVLNIVVFLLIAVFAIRPKISEIVALQNQITTQQATLAEVKQQSTMVDLAIKNFSSLDGTTKDKTNSLIPDRTDITQLTTSITSLISAKEASLSGIQFQPILLSGAPKQLSRTPKIDKISFTLSSQGGYSNLISEISSLINLERIVGVDTVNFSPQPQGSGLIMIVNGEAFVAKDE